jgi:hypothetical protein
MAVTKYTLFIHAIFYIFSATAQFFLGLNVTVFILILNFPSFLLAARRRHCPTGVNKMRTFTHVNY